MLEAIANPGSPDELNAERPINEFEFFNTRLRPIDYKEIIRTKVDWEDPYFKADQSSFLDPKMKML